ncbi:MAG: alkaline phosphatase family protein [Candidatus Bathyarchaeia archaeon]|jgi:hypothetical protein
MIDHVFVVMLENRSFDHMLGFSQIQGTDPSGTLTKIEGLTGKESNISLNGDLVNVSSPADFVLNYGPGHEFNDVKEQLCGKGFQGRIKRNSHEPKLARNGCSSWVVRLPGDFRNLLSHCFGFQFVSRLTGSGSAPKTIWIY